jgi:hypothetical protein
VPDRADLRPTSRCGPSAPSPCASAPTSPAC